MSKVNEKLCNTAIYVGDNEKLREGAIEYYQENGFIVNFISKDQEYIGVNEFYINSYAEAHVYARGSKIIKLPHESFFSPVQGGQNHGYTFLQFISSPQRWGTLLVSLLFIAWVINIGQKEHIEVEVTAIPLAFLSAIFFGLIFLHLRKWNDLKNHKSR